MSLKIETLNINKEKENNDFIIPLILKAIEQHLDANELKALLRGCLKITLVTWKDEYSLDLLHYCILHNNIVALLVLLNQGCFKPPYSPAAWPYLHLVACLGYASLISTIIQEINFQNEACMLDWGVHKVYILPKTNAVTSVLIENFKDQKFTPVDIAAIFQHLNCVELLLDFWQIQRSNSNINVVHNTRNSSGYLALACKVNSPSALQLLLTKYTEKKEALECAIRMLSFDCVDIILRQMDGQAVKKAFQGMNLFHVTFTYSCCLTDQQYEAMVETTKVLIKHNQNVNSMQPSRTFPLYSILSHSLAGIRMEECSHFLIDIVRILLKARADPNIDEIRMEEESKDSEESTAFGRQPYSSAVNCLLSNIPVLKRNESFTQIAVKSVDQYSYYCIKLLLKHGADLLHTGKFFSFSSNEGSLTDEYHHGTSLHLMMSTRPVGQLSFSVLRLLLHSGINADACGAWSMPFYVEAIKYALNILPLSLWSQSITHPHSMTPFSDEDLKCFIYISKFMSQSSLVGAYKEFLDAVEFFRALAKENNTLEITERFYFENNQMLLQIIKQYDKVTKEPWTLQHCCSNIIWQHCKRKKKSVLALPIPAPLKVAVMFSHKKQDLVDEKVVH
ncbi:uncharacterized protein LOC106052664 [Biomphalaria glabrata]|uniref:Uncharacterized protein LOC106052664 n=1 Tax=Biomphalaria glabrata TaxID=6526 RepID=A0A9W3ARG7_BIOGL|nr:uncharacterized protein LOC106052664 [Biomphalaria glabrata]XP_055889855.1 uncharacterized protein LOC106052664 [Biomphalaria glabrata]